jgi:hypothetical protein
MNKNTSHSYTAEGMYIHIYIEVGGWVLLLLQTLPVAIDVGTNTESLLNNPFYIGLRQKRATGTVSSSNCVPVPMPSSFPIIIRIHTIIGAIFFRSFIQLATFDQLTICLLHELFHSPPTD